MPAYNAARTLEATYRGLAMDVVDEVILVDDVSHDETVDIAERLGLKVVVHLQNRGYGGNQKTCYLEALRSGADGVEAWLAGQGDRLGRVRSTLEEIAGDVDYVLVMSVNPGFGGQKFIPATLEKIRRLHATIRERGLKAQIEVDGGVDESNIRALVEAGAEVLVAGSAVFGHGDPEGAARRLIEAAR